MRKIFTLEDLKLDLIDLHKERGYLLNEKQKKELRTITGQPSKTKLTIYKRLLKAMRRDLILYFNGASTLGRNPRDTFKLVYRGDRIRDLGQDMAYLLSGLKNLSIYAETLIDICERAEMTLEYEIKG